MSMMSHIATMGDSSKKTELKKSDDGPGFCENWIDELDKMTSKKISYFLIPGDSEISSICHVIRTKIRTTERRIVSLNREEKLDEYILMYINRLSDLFFTLARADLVKK
jgi:ATP:cob(I)alamin adenosyltransferase